jgi:hypothetical protein
MIRRLKMKKLFIMQIIIGVVLSLSIIPANAQDIEDGVNAYKDAYYGPTSFSRLAGDDGVLSEEDWMNNRSAIETKYGADFRWKKAMGFDADGDGALSTTEARAYRNAEAKRLKSEWRAKGDKLTPEDKKWLKNHPIVVESLAQNHTYLENHPEVAKTIYSDRKWLNAHPEAAKKLYNNRKWLNNHPEASKKAYRAAKKHPNKAKKIYKAGKRHPNKTKKAARNLSATKKRAKVHKK